MNPFEGVKPDISIFGAEVNTLLVLLVGGFWALVFFACAYGALVGTGKWAVARHNNRSEEMTEAAGQLKKALLALGVCAGLGIIFGAILFVVGMVQGS